MPTRTLRSTVYRVIWLIVLVGLFMAMPAWSATRYASPTGSGSACTIINTPCSLATAVSQANAGDLIYLRGGTYTITVDFASRSGTNGNPITYSGYPNETAILRWSLGFNAEGLGANIHDITLSNLTIDGSTTTSYEVGIFL